CAPHTYPPSLPVVAQPVRRVNPHVSPHRLFISPYSRPRIAIPAVSGSSSGARRGSRRKHARTRGQSAPRDGVHRATGVLLDPSNDPYPTRPLSLTCRSPVAHLTKPFARTRCWGALRRAALEGSAATA